MSTPSAIELLEQQALDAIESGDPADASHFAQATGMQPTDFQAQLLAQGAEQLALAVEHHQRAATACRMDDLVGQDYQVLPFRELPIGHQLSLAHYLAVECDSWEHLYDPEQLRSAGAAVALEQAMQEYVRVYGDEPFGVTNLAAPRLIQAVMADEDIADAYSSWAAYTSDYGVADDIPDHGPVNRWPVILSQDNYETILDGWHRFHSYMRAGMADVPAVFFPEARHLELAAEQAPPAFTMFHASKHAFNFPDMEKLNANRENHANGGLGLWVSAKSDWISSFGTNLYEVQIAGSVLEVPIGEFRKWGGNDPDDAFFSEKRAELLADGVAYIRVIELNGLSAMGVVVDFNAIEQFKQLEGPRPVMDEAPSPGM